LIQIISEKTNSKNGNEIFFDLLDSFPELI